MVYEGDNYDGLKASVMALPSVTCPKCGQGALLADRVECSCGKMVYSGDKWREWSTFEKLFSSPVVRALMPAFAVAELVQLQPMNLPVGQVFYMDLVYGGALPRQRRR